jgi:hypothetical protein
MRLRRARARLGERSIGVGGDAIRSILVTGDHNTVFVGEYECLADAYIEPWLVFKRVDVSNFTGRDWLVAEVDAFLGGHDCGYFILEAKAGLGKSAFLAHLVFERYYVHHFVERARGPGGLELGLKNLAAQLLLAGEQGSNDANTVLASAANQPHYLADLLEKVARNLPQERWPKIVVVVDGLDEAGEPPYGQNPMGLPEVLPRGVFFIVSQRPGTVPLRVETPRRVFRLEAEGPQNVEDVRAYLVEKALGRDAIRRAVRASGYTERKFVEKLLAKSEGNWIYLHYVLAEIEGDKGRRVQIDALPNGLWQWYAKFWQRWRDDHPGDWEAHLRLLTALAALQEDATLKRLCTLAEVAERPDLHRLLDTHWRSFLDVQEGEERRYRLFHASLRDFLAGFAESEAITEDADFARELRRGSQRTHGQIARRYLDAWGGLDAGLPRLQDESLRDLDGRYGIRHLATHLAGACSIDELHRLLRLEWLGRNASAANVWYTVHDQTGELSIYLSDLARAGRMAAEESALNLARGEPAAAIGLELRYALLSASVRSLAQNIRTPLLLALVEKGIWTVEQALPYIGQTPEIPQRVETLARVSVSLDDPQKAELLREALTAVRSADDPDRSRALAALAPYLPDRLLPEALEVAWALEPVPRAWVFAALAPCLPVPQQNELLEETLSVIAPAFPERLLADELRKVGALKDEWERGEGLATVGPVLSGQLLTEALQLAREIGDPGARARGLAALVPTLPEPEKSNVLEEALAAAGAAESAEGDESALIALAPHRPKADAPFLHGLEGTNAVFEDLLRARLLAMLAPHLREPLLARALAAVSVLGNQRGRSEALSSLAPYLPQSLLAEALTTAMALSDEGKRANALAALVPHLPEPLAAEALEVARTLGVEGPRAAALAAVACASPESAKSRALAEALAAARAIPHEHSEDAGPAITVRRFGIKIELPEREIEAERWRADSLALLAPHLPEPEKSVALEEAVAAARKIEYPQWRAESLAALASQLTPAQSHRVLEEALQAALSDSWEGGASALADLAPHLPESLLTQALTKSIESDVTSADLVAALAPHLSEPLLVKALLATRAIRDDPARAGALAALAPYLSEPDKSAVLERALAAALAVTNESPRVASLAVLAPHLREPLLSKIVTAARSMGWPNDLLVPVAPFLSAPLLEEALTAVFGADRDAWERIAVLRTLVPHLPEPLLCEALGSVRAMQSEAARTPALALFVPYLPDAQKRAVVEEIVNAALAIEESSERATLLGDIARESAPQLPDLLTRAVVEEAVKAALAIEESSERATLLGDIARELAPQLPDPLTRAVVEEAVKAALAIEESSKRAHLLGYLARELGPQLPDAVKRVVFREALAAARGFESIEERTQALATLSVHLPEPEKRDVFAEALTTARALPNTSRASMLQELTSELAQHLDEPQKRAAAEEILSAALAIKDKRKRASEVARAARLVPHLAEPRKRALAEESVRLAQAIGDEDSRVWLLPAVVELACHLKERQKRSVQEGALEAALAMRNEHARAFTLAAFADHLPEPLKTQARDGAQANRNERVGLTELVGRVEQLPAPSGETARDLWRQISPLLGSETRESLLDGLCKLAPLVGSIGGETAVGETMRAIVDAGRWLP